MACEVCGAPPGWVDGARLERANESKRAAMQDAAKLREVLQAILDDYEDGRGYTNLDDELAEMARTVLATTPNA